MIRSGIILALAMGTMAAEAAQPVTMATGNDGDLVVTSVTPRDPAVGMVVMTAGSPSSATAGAASIATTGSSQPQRNSAPLDTGHQH